MQLDWVRIPCPVCLSLIMSFHLVELDLYEVRPHGGCSGDGAQHDGETIRGAILQSEFLAAQ